MLKTIEAADLLGMRSVNTLKTLVRRLGVRVQYHGNRMMIPVSELERLETSDMLRGIRASDRLHEASVGLGRPDGLSALTCSLLGCDLWPVRRGELAHGDASSQ